MDLPRKRHDEKQNMAESFSSLIKCSSIFITLKLSAGDGGQWMPCHDAELLSFLIFEHCWTHYTPTLLPFIVISPLLKALFAFNFLDHFLTNVVELVWQWNHFWTNIYLLLASEVLDPIGCLLNYHVHAIIDG